MALGSTQPLTEMSTRSISWGKGDRCVRLTTLPPSCAVVTKFGNLHFLQPSRAFRACNGTALPLPLPSPHLDRFTTNNSTSRLTNQQINFKKTFVGFRATTERDFKNQAKSKLFSFFFYFLRDLLDRQYIQDVQG